MAAVNALPTPPDFIVFTGDLTHTTDDLSRLPQQHASRHAAGDALRAKVRTQLTLPAAAQEPLPAMQFWAVSDVDGAEL